MNKNKSLFVIGIISTFLYFSCSKSDQASQVNPISKPITQASKASADTVWEYVPAPGQFINTSAGNAAGATSVLNNGLVSLGGFGGYIVLGFDHSVLNKDGMDLKITGNATAQLAEPGVIWVMQDKNNNGLPDDIWYEIKGSAYAQTGYQKDYQVTYYKALNTTDDIKWTDNKGNSGVIKHNIYHSQSYYPSWTNVDQYTLSGTLLPKTNIDSSNINFIISSPFKYGYADNTSGGDSIDISDAMDEKGNSVSLQSIDFVKIQTGIQADLGWLGEFSTEVSQVIDLHIIK